MSWVISHDFQASGSSWKFFRVQKQLPADPKILLSLSSFPFSLFNMGISPLKTDDIFAAAHKVLGKSLRWRGDSRPSSTMEAPAAFLAMVLPLYVRPFFAPLFFF